MILSTLLTLIASVAAGVTPLAAPSLVPAPYGQTPLGLASNGTDYVAVWFDERSSLDFEQARTHALFGSRLTNDGTPAAPAGRRLSTDVYNAKIAGSGAGYLLAYADATGLFTVPLDAEGVPAGAATTLGAPNSAPLALAANGSNFLLLHTLSGYAGAQASILAPDGSLIRTTPLAEYIQGSPIWVLSDGSYQFVVFRFYCNGVTACIASVVLTTVMSGGAITEARLYDVSQASRIAAAYGNGRVLIASQSDTQAGRFVEYRLFDSGGTLLHSAVQIASESLRCVCAYSTPAVGWDGSEFLLVYQWPSADEQTSDLRAVRVTSDAVLLDFAAPILLDPAGGTPPLFATNGTTTAVVWGSDLRNFDAVSRAVHSFDDLAGAAQHVVAQSAALERGVHLASGPGGVLAVWREGYPTPSIVASVVGRNPVTISPAGPLDLQTPAAARGRDAFLVVWREQRVDQSYRPSTFRILARRVAFDGLPIDASPFVVASETSPAFTAVQPTISVASDGTDWLIVYPGDQLTVRGVRVSATGAVLDSAPIVLSQTGLHFGIPGSPHVLWSGSRYVVVWAEDSHNPSIVAPPGPPASFLYEARVTAAGELIDTRQIWVGGFALDLALAAAPARLLLAWAESGVSIDTMILGDDGTPVTTARAITTLPVSARQTVLTDVEAAWDGASFATAWTEKTGPEAHIRFEHADGNGLPIESSPLELAPELGTKYAPALATSPGGVTIAFQAIADTFVARAFATTIDRAGVPPRRRAAH